MNRKIEEFLIGKGLSVTGDKAYGTVNGYEVNVIITVQFSMEINVYFTCKADQTLIDDLKADKKLKGIKLSKFALGVKASMLGSLASGAVTKSIDNAMESVTQALKERNVAGAEYCPVCGEKFDENKVAKQHNMSGVTVSLDDECLSKLNEDIKEENEKFAYSAGNYGKGFLGALVGTLAGAAIAVALFYAGFIAAISSLVAAVLGFFLYRKFGGKEDKKMIIIVSLTVIIGMELAVLGVYIGEIASAGAQYGYTFSEAWQIVMEDKVFFDSFIINLVLTFVFSVVGMVEEVWRNYIRTKRQDLIK